MSTSTHFKLLNANDPKYLAARAGTPEDKQNWEDDWGSIEDNPGAPINPNDVYNNDCVEETEDEYGGWIIDLSKLPKNVTHIKIERF